MTVLITLNGKAYKRDYKPNFCDLPGCGLRLQFRLTSQGIPESSDKYNARRCCCAQHSAELQKRRIRRKRPAFSIIDFFLFGGCMPEKTVRRCNPSKQTLTEVTPK
jgi:hypothetical protein